MKISTRTRNDAALACAMAASTNRGRGVADAVSLMRGIDYVMFGTGDAVGVTDDPAIDLIDAAFEEAYKHDCSKREDGGQDWVAQMAEAEAMIRTGWSPP